MEGHANPIAYWREREPESPDQALGERWQVRFLRGQLFRCERGREKPVLKPGPPQFFPALGIATAARIVRWPSSFVWWRGRNSFFPTSTKRESRLAGTPCFCYGNSEAAALKETRGIRSGGKWHTVWQPTDELVIGTCGKAIL